MMEMGDCARVCVRNSRVGDHPCLGKSDCRRVAGMLPSPGHRKSQACKQGAPEGRLTCLPPGTRRAGTQHPEPRTMRCQGAFLQQSPRPAHSAAQPSPRHASVAKEKEWADCRGRSPTLGTHAGASSRVSGTLGPKGVPRVMWYWGAVVGQRADKSPRVMRYTIRRKAEGKKSSSSPTGRTGGHCSACCNSMARIRATTLA